MSKSALGVRRRLLLRLRAVTVRKKNRPASVGCRTALAIHWLADWTNLPSPSEVKLPLPKWPF
jgi:hypothetical protein